MNALLEIDGTSAGYGPMQVLWDVHIGIEPGECVVLLGANGSGKTTLLRSLLGLMPVLGGSIRFRDRPIDRLAADRRVREGIAFMSEIGAFLDLTVEENLIVGGYHVPRARVRRRIKEVLELFPDLRDRTRTLAGSLSGGQRKMLGIAKTLMGDPSLVVLDEPSAGLSPRLVGEVVTALGRLHAQGIALFVAEQNIRFLEIADRAYVLDGGRVAFQGTVEALRANDAVRRAYFGIEGR